eukprot:668856-Karenia_brevis.AAC.1
MVSKADLQALLNDLQQSVLTKATHDMEEMQAMHEKQLGELQKVILQQKAQLEDLREVNATFLHKIAVQKKEAANHDAMIEKLLDAQ